MFTGRDGIFGNGPNSFLGFFRAEREAKVELCGEQLERKVLSLAQKVSGMV